MFPPQETILIPPGKQPKIPTVLNPVNNGAAARSAARCLQESFDPLGHKYVDTVVDATYDAKGYTPA